MGTYRLNIQKHTSRWLEKRLDLVVQVDTNGNMTVHAEVTWTKMSKGGEPSGGKEERANILEASKVYDAVT